MIPYKMLAPIIEYDTSKHTHLLDTLRVYLSCIERQRAIQLLTDFSVRKTAEKNRRILQETDLAGCSVGAMEKPSFFEK